MKRTTALLLLLPLCLTVPATPLLGNGGTIRVSNVPVGPFIVTIYTSPTPLRTGEIDVSVLAQDSAGAVLTPAVLVDARPVALEPDLAEDVDTGPVQQRATRGQATNKLFQAAKFDIEAPGEWEFTVTIAEAGSLSFESEVARSTLLDRPYLLAALVLLPLLVLGWLALGRGEDEEEERATTDR